MTRPISELTYKIIAFPTVRRIAPQLPHLDTGECIDWAIEMIELGHEGRSLFMLASVEKTTSYFEIADLLQKSVSEVGLTLRSGDKEAIISYSAYYILQISRGIDVKKNIEYVHWICSSGDNDPAIFDFSLLYWAWGDISYHTNPDYNHYWPGVSMNNIEGIIVNKAIEWLEIHKEEYTQP